MGVQASVPPRAHVGPVPLLGGVLGAIALGVAAAIVLAVCGVHIATAAGSRGTTASSGPTPSQRPLRPGTYSAGTLQAPLRLGNLGRLDPTQRSQTGLLQSQRDALAAATGKPAIAAQYGRSATFQVLPVVLVASSGYVDPKQFLAGVTSEQVALSGEGADQCAVYRNLAVLCMRSDQQKQLTVLVEGAAPYADSAQKAAQLVDDGWKKLGG